MAAPDGGRTARVEIASPGAAALRVALAVSAAHRGHLGALRRIGGERDRIRRLSGQCDRRRVAALRTLLVAGPRRRYGNDRIPRRRRCADRRCDAAHSARVASSRDRRGSAVAVAEGREGHRHRRRRRVRDRHRVRHAAEPGRARTWRKAVAKLHVRPRRRSQRSCARGVLLNDSRAVVYAVPALGQPLPRIARASPARSIRSGSTTRSRATARRRRPYVQLTGGAMLLGRSADRDWSIVRLLDTPPAGAQFAAWRAEAVAGRHGGRHDPSSRGRSQEIEQGDGDGRRADR